MKAPSKKNKKSAEKWKKSFAAWNSLKKLFFDIRQEKSFDGTQTHVGDFFWRVLSNDATGDFLARLFTFFMGDSHEENLILNYKINFKHHTYTKIF